MEMSPIRDCVEHVKAVAEFWASQYKLDATSEQIELFKQTLRIKVESELNSCIWEHENPRSGSYLRKFIAYCDYHLSPVLEQSAKEAGLSTSFLSWNQAVLSIDPDGVKTHPSGEIVWKPANQH